MANFFFTVIYNYGLCCVFSIVFLFAVHAWCLFQNQELNLITIKFLIYSSMILKSINI